VGQGYVVSDGSFCKLAGAAAWIIEGLDHINQSIGTIYMLVHDQHHNTTELPGIF